MPAESDARISHRARVVSMFAIATVCFTAIAASGDYFGPVAGLTAAVGAAVIWGVIYHVW